MDSLLESLMTELEQFGRAHDAARPAFEQRMLNITRDTGKFLNVLIRGVDARRVLEIGTSNGYSTLWLAHAAGAIDATVTTIELSRSKYVQAAANFERSGLGGIIAQVEDDAGVFLKSCDDAAYDLVFLDSERSEYVAWWGDLSRVVRGGGLLVVDNATSHPHELEPFVDLVTTDPGWSTCTVPVGKGEFLAWKSRNR